MCRVRVLCVEWMVYVSSGFCVSSFKCRVLCIELYVWNFMCRVGVLCQCDVLSQVLCRFYVSSVGFMCRVGVVCVEWI
jgi:hypothetical protein